MMAPLLYLATENTMWCYQMVVKEICNRQKQYISPVQGQQAENVLNITLGNKSLILQIAFTLYIDKNNS